MKIAIMGAQGTGKTSYIREFLNQWPMYQMPERSFRNVVAEKKAKVNRQGNCAGQQLIRDALIEQAIDMPGKQFVLHDRCILDNLAYTLYLSEQQDNDITSQFIRETVFLAKNAVRLYDIIFYLPLSTDYETPSTSEQIEQRLVERDNDLEFRQSIDNIMQTFVAANVERKGFLFDPTDSPPVITLPGTVGEKILLTNLYVDKNGNPYETGVLLNETPQTQSSIIVPK